MISCETSTKQQKEKATSPIEGLACPYQSVKAAVAAGIKPRAAVDFLQWAKDNVKFEEGSPLPGPYDAEKFDYFTEILRKLQPDDPCREVTLRGSAQLGKTVVAMIFTGGSLDLDPCPFMYIHPTLDNGRLWDDTKWQPFLDTTAELHKAFPASKASRKDKNRAFFKQRKDRRGFLRISGANSADSLSMITVRRMVKDDLSKWEKNKGGDPEAQSNSRMSAYEYDAKCLNISTPLFKDACRVSAKYDESDKRVRMVPCPHCDHFHELTWENFRRCISDDMDPAKAHFSCPECGGVIEQKHRNAMLARGKWVATQTDRPREPGYHLWQAYSQLRSWASIAKGWISAKDDPESEQTFYNDVLGLPYEQKSEAPPWEEILKRAKASTYPQGIIPPGYPLLSIGVDVQGDRIEWLLVAFGPHGRRYAVQCGVIEHHISTDDAVSQLNMLLKREWRNYLGAKHRADILVIDMGYEADDVKRWSYTHDEARVIAVKGRGESTAPAIYAQTETDAAGNKKQKSKRLWNMGTSSLKSSLYKNLEKAEPDKRGYCGFANDFEEEFFKQLCSEHRTVIHKKGEVPEVVWKRIGDTRNEVLDMMIYAEGGARRKNWHTVPLEEWERLIAEREKAPQGAQLDLLDVDLMKPQKADLAAEAQEDEKKPQPPPPPKPRRRVRSKGI
jgi:phage terminase large subunit GpA-like protein